MMNGETVEILEVAWDEVHAGPALMRKEGSARR